MVKIFDKNIHIIVLIIVFMFITLLNVNTYARIDNELPIGVVINGSHTIYVGETTKLTATVKPNNATSKKVTWTSSNTRIATIDRSGNVKGIKSGVVRITATTVNGKTSSHMITVKVRPIEPTGITIYAPKSAIYVGDSMKLTATVTPKNATNKTVVWTSSNTKVATVDKSGNVKGVGAGSVVITAQTLNRKKATCSITVKEVKATGITIYAPKSAIYVGDSMKLTATITPKNTTNKTVVWTSSNTKVATVDRLGNVKAIKAGSVVITAQTLNGKKSTCKIEVVAVNYRIVNNANRFAKYIADKRFYQAHKSSWSGSCLGFAEVYANAIYKNKFYLADEELQTGLNNNNDPKLDGVSFSSYSSKNKKLVLQKIYDNIANGKPCVLQVNGNTKGTSRHYVTVIGYKSNATRSSIQETDLLILDAWDGIIEEMNGKGTGSRFMITGEDTGRTYGYQIYYMY